MEVIKAGHKYSLENYGMDAEKTGKTQEIQFIEKEQKIGEKMALVNEGTTNEEVLRVLINRFQVLNAEIPCRENSIVITKLEEAFMWINHRTEDRKNRGVLQTTAK